jgi:Spy/CpxP family protein refolding chaperone
MKKITVILVFVLSMGTLLAQQGPPAMGPRSGTPRLDALKSFLQLSDQQVQNLTALLTSFRDAVKPIHEQIMTKQKELRQELDKASPDPSVVAQLMVDVKNLRNQIKTKRDELRPQLVAILSDSQKSALATLQQALSLQQAAHQAVESSLIEAPQNNPSDTWGFGRGWGGMHPRP